MGLSPFLPVPRHLMNLFRNLTGGHSSSPSLCSRGESEDREYEVSLILTELADRPVVLGRIGVKDRAAASPRVRDTGIFFSSFLQDWERSTGPASLAAGLPEFPLQISGLIRFQKQRVAVCAGGTQRSPSLLGPCLELVT